MQAYTFIGILIIVCIAQSVTWLIFMLIISGLEDEKTSLFISAGITLALSAFMITALVFTENNKAEVTETAEKPPIILIERRYNNVTNWRPDNMR